MGRGGGGLARWLRGERCAGAVAIGGTGSMAWVLTYGANLLGSGEVGEGSAAL